MATEKDLISKEKVQEVESFFGVLAEQAGHGTMATVTNNSEMRFILEPSAGILPSIARLISMSDVCGCVYIDCAKEELWYATNETRSGNRERYLESFLQFFPTIKKLLSTSAKGRENFFFKERDRDRFIRESLHIKSPFFLHRLANLRRRIESRHEMKKSRIAQQILENVYGERGTVPGFRQIDNFRNQINNRIREHHPRQDMKILLGKVSLALEDLINLAGLKNSINGRIIIQTLARGSEIPMALSARKPPQKRTLHCEMVMLEHLAKDVSGGRISKEFYATLSTAIGEQRFAVSKLCCMLCRASLEGIRRNFCAGQREQVIAYQKMIFETLGHSCTFFGH